MVEAATEDPSAVKAAWIGSIIGRPWERTVTVTEIQIFRIITSSAAEKLVMKIIFMNDVVYELLGKSMDMPISLRELK